MWKECLYSKVFKCVNKTTLSKKQRGELNKAGLSVSERRCRRSPYSSAKSQTNSTPCSVRSVHELLRKFKETGCICDRTRSASVEVVVSYKVHLTITSGSLDTARSLNLPKTSWFCALFRGCVYRFQHVIMLQTVYVELHIGFASFSLMRYEYVSGPRGYHKRMRYITL